jgi:EAL domain-containing protein (putative c-di-GMP-specific phosphodiesterase class I)
MKSGNIHIEILRAVTQLGVDFAQGYRVREPEHIDAFDFVDCGTQRPPDAARA